MKKVFRLITLSILITFILSASVAIAANTAIAVSNSQESIEQQLIGTWQWDYGDYWLLIFREDGTLLDGPPGLRTTYNWQVADGRLFVDGDDWNMRIDGNTLTLDRFGSDHTYFWYSDSTEGEESLWALGVIALGCIFTIAVIAVVIILFFVLRNRRQKQEMQAQMAQMQSQLHNQPQQFGNHLSQQPPFNNHQPPIQRH
ncbi:MAG: hypothetical protein FWC81_02890 [Coriobacteriia bacterium]|nr:hypothetical protein [Coriobacteriia bacterium]